MRTAGTLLLVILVLIAGCSGVLVQDDMATTETMSSTTTDTPTPTPTLTPSPTPTPTPEWENPWGKETVIVGIANDLNERDLEPLVRNAVEYWNENSTRFGGHDVKFLVMPDAGTPDIEVSFVERVDECGTSESSAEELLGCAPVNEEGSRVTGTQEVRIEAGYSDETTLEIIKHEFGHVHGLEHGDEPAEIMNATTAAVTVPKPDAVDRDLPWRTSDLTVYVDYTNSSHHETTYRYQIERALEYFNDGAEGTVPDELNLTFVSDESEADITIEFHKTTTGHSDPWTNSEVRGYDVDDDGRLEFFDAQAIVLQDIEEDAVGWFVAYWLAYGQGLSAGELPPPLVDASYEDRRSHWWL